MRQIFSILIFIFSINSFAQVNDSLIRMQVLNKGIVDSIFIYGKWTKDGGTQTELKYLGLITTDSGKVYKIVNSSWIFGFAERATNRILIFDDENRYIGNYGLFTKSDLPDKLINNQLIFTNSDNNGCDKLLITKIDLSQGLPKHIFIKCNGLDGDLFVFSIN